METETEKLLTVNRASEINQLHSEICGIVKMTIEKAIRIGELLIEQKAECGHGYWEPWMRENLQFSPRSAKRYMNCYRHRDQLKSATVADLPGIVELARVYDLPEPEEKPENVEKIQQPKATSGPHPLSDDEKKFQETQKIQDKSPLNEKQREEIEHSMKFEWKMLTEHVYYNDLQLEEIIQMHLDFWQQKQNEIVQKRFRVMGNTN